MDENTAPQNDQNKGQTLVEVESLILRYIGDMEKLRQEIKDQKDMFESAYKGDANYSKKAEEQEKVKREVAATKEVLLKTPAATEAQAKANELKDELKGIQETITTLLKQRQKLTEATQIIRDDGEVFEVKTKLSLVKVNPKKA